MKHNLQLIQNKLPLLDEGYSMELYMNHLHDAILVLISPSSIEHHFDVDLTYITHREIQWLESTSINIIPLSDEHLEPLQYTA